jgi:colicin import membrane protein
MASRRAERSFAFVLSILVHAAIVIALTVSVPIGMSRPMQPNAVAIETVMIDESAVAAEMARIEAAEQAEIQQREDEARQAREAAERLERERVAAEQRVQEQQAELARIQREREQAEQDAESERIRLQAEADEEARRLAAVEEERREAERIAEQERIAREQEEARLEAERREQERIEAERREQERIAAEERAREEARIEAERQARIAAIEAETQRAIEAEQQARAAIDSGLRDQWARAISARVQLYWTRPPIAQVGLECVVIVTQLPNGDVTDVMIERCNPNEPTIIRSVENAVLNASPLPRPPNGVPFERVVRITFIPDE